MHKLIAFYIKDYLRRAVFGLFLMQTLQGSYAKVKAKQKPSISQARAKQKLSKNLIKLSNNLAKRKS